MAIWRASSNQGDKGPLVPRAFPLNQIPQDIIYFHYAIRLLSLLKCQRSGAAFEESF